MSTYIITDIRTTTIESYEPAVRVLWNYKEGDEQNSDKHIDFARDVSIEKVPEPVKESTSNVATDIFDLLTGAVEYYGGKKALEDVTKKLKEMIA